METKRRPGQACDTTLAETLSALEARLAARTPAQIEADKTRAAEEETAIARGQALRRLSVLASDLGKRYAPDRASFERFTIYHEAQRKVYASLISMDVLEVSREGRSLILYGSYGTGKDHLLAACLYRAASLGADCRWICGQEIFGEFRDAIKEERSEAAILKQLAGPDILGLSDPIPPANAQAYQVHQLYRLIDRRYRALKATWVTLNIADPNDGYARLTDPIFDRLRDGAIMLPCFWPSYRERE